MEVAIAVVIGVVAEVVDGVGVVVTDVVEIVVVEVIGVVVSEVVDLVSAVVGLLPYLYVHIFVSLSKINPPRHANCFVLYVAVFKVKHT